MPASTTTDWALMPLERGLSRNAADVGHLLRLHRLSPRNHLLGIQIGVDIARDAGRGRGLQQRRATALKRTREKRLNDLARNASDESRAALIGAMKP